MTTKKQLINEIEELRHEITLMQMAQNAMNDIIMEKLESIEKDEPDIVFDEDRDPEKELEKMKREENRRNFNIYCNTVAFGARPFSRRRNDE